MNVIGAFCECEICISYLKVTYVVVASKPTLTPTSVYWRSGNDGDITMGYFGEDPGVHRQ